jgi:hypothetical protein
MRKIADMKYTFVELDDRARNYMVEKINSIMTLSRAVLEHLDMPRGVVYSIWPEGAVRDEIYSFEDGVGGGLLRHREIRKEFIDYISRFLSGGSDKIVVFENSSLERNAPCLDTAESQLLFHGNEVYHFLLGQDNQPDRILVHYDEGFNTWRNCVLFSSVPAGTKLADRGVLDAELIDALALRCEKLAIDAYDLDGHLIWNLLDRNPADGL